MSDAKISALPSAATLTGAERLPVSQSNQTRGATAAQLLSSSLFTQTGTGAVARSINSKFGDIVSVKDFGAIGDGVTDDTAAINAAVASLLSSVGPREIYFPAGIWRFASKPNAIPVGITLVGSGRRNTYLLRDYTAGSATEAFIEWNGSTINADSGGLRNLALYAATGTTSGAAIKLSGISDSNRASHTNFDNVEVSGVGTWAYGLYSDGSSFTTLGSQGIRDAQFTGLDIFQCTTHGIYLKNAVGWRFLGLGLFGTCDLLVDGAGAGTSNSASVFFSEVVCNDELAVQNCDNVHFSSCQAADLTIASTATNIIYLGFTTNAPTNNSPSSSLILRPAQATTSWTPTIRGAGTAGTQTYATQVGRYMRIGNIVYFHCYIVLSAFDGATNGNISIAGLPFTAAALSSGHVPCAVSDIANINLHAGYSQYEARVGQSTTEIALVMAGDTVAFDAVTQADMANNSAINVGGFYFV